MKLADFVAVMERIAPPSLAMEYDNVGLLLGTDRNEINKVLVALDCTPATAQEAIDWGADLLLTHHPIFFNGVKHIRPDDPETGAPYLLLRNGIAHYAAHTNLDAAPGGVNDCLAEILGLTDVVPLSPDGLGRIGIRGGDTPATLGAYAEFVSKTLGTAVRMTGSPNSPVSHIAMVGGGGGDMFRQACDAGADLYITGEVKHHQALDARFLGLNMLEAGHYETEKIALFPLIRHLQELTNDVQYRLTLSEAPCLARIF
ncbi:MAG: Nif3-like dinuclear metal center hexameric protein [Clostridiales bacterium]|nr:Nif3-like dinuclear metal center hexameric protein [Clostridiales bacterium]